MKQTPMPQMIFLGAAAASLIGWLLFGEQRKTIVETKLKDKTAELLSPDAGLSKALTRPANGMMVD